jgi:hypothetical protein
MAQTKSKSTARSGGRSPSRKKPVDNATAAKQAAAAGTRAAGLAVAGAAKRARVPLVMGGAAAAGLAGGLVAIRARAARRRPALDMSSVAAAAKQVSALTGQIADVAGAMQQRRER